MRWLAIAFAAGCGSPRPAPAGQPPPSPAPVARGSAAPVAMQPAPPPPVAPVAPPEPPPEIIAACRGPKLDLRKLVAGGECLVKTAQQPIPPAVVASVDPAPVIVKSGGKTAAAIVLTNTGTEEARLYLNESCGHLIDATYEMLVGNGERIDLEAGGCGLSSGCPPRILGIALPPQGTLRLTVDIVARIETFDATCHSKRVKPVPKGKYDLKLYSMLADADGTIDVR